MPYFVGAGGVWKQVGASSVGAGSAWKSVLGKWVGAGGAWKSFFTALSVTANNVTRATSSLSPCSAIGTSGTPGAIVTGGSGSFTYSWARSGGCHADGCLVCNAPTSLNPTWNGKACDDGVLPKSETWVLTVTDTVTGLTATATITVTFTHTNLS